MKKASTHLLFGVFSLLILGLGVHFSLSASRFYENWDGWRHKFKGEKVMPDDWDWGPDVLPGYESRFVNQGEAFDGPARSCIIRLRGPKDSRKGFLYVHGFNDVSYTHL
ncbi:MAG: hypothetical protein K2K29_01825, partial [Muribaculaceae bacterium]|nr:hypothetical protein [Muribaculaceae bacterium]